MDENQILTKVIRIISDFTDVKVRDIRENSLIVSELGITSFDMVSLVVSFEEEFDLEIDNFSSLNKINTVGELVWFVSQEIERNKHKEI